MAEVLVIVVAVTLEITGSALGVAKVKLADVVDALELLAEMAA